MGHDRRNKNNNTLSLQYLSERSWTIFVYDPSIACTVFVRVVGSRVLLSVVVFVSVVQTITWPSSRKWFRIRENDARSPETAAFASRSRLPTPSYLVRRTRIAGLWKKTNPSVRLKRCNWNNFKHIMTTTVCSPFILIAAIVATCHAAATADEKYSSSSRLPCVLWSRYYCCCYLFILGRRSLTRAWDSTNSRVHSKAFRSSAKSCPIRYVKWVMIWCTVFSWIP